MAAGVFDVEVDVVAWPVATDTRLGSVTHACDAIREGDQLPHVGANGGACVEPAPSCGRRLNSYPPGPRVGSC
jgi:hypothetical protein